MPLINASIHGLSYGVYGLECIRLTSHSPVRCFRTRSPFIGPTIPSSLFFEDQVLLIHLCMRFFLGGQLGFQFFMLAVFHCFRPGKLQVLLHHTQNFKCFFCKKLTCYIIAGITIYPILYCLHCLSRYFSYICYKPSYHPVLILVRSSFKCFCRLNAFNKVNGKILCLNSMANHTT